MTSELTSVAVLPDLAGIPITDQGVRPICVALAVTGAHEIARSHQKSSPWVLLSPEAIWGHAWERGLAGANGTYLFAMSDALSDRGQPELSKWPIGATDWSSPPEAAGHPPWHRAQLYELLPAARVLQEEVSGGQPVVLIIHVTDEFYDVDAMSGRVAAPAVGAPTYGLHAVLCVGHAKDGEGQSYFLIRNSWGTAWGNGGYAWLPESYVADFATQMGRVAPLPSVQVGSRHARGRGRRGRRVGHVQ